MSLTKEIIGSFTDRRYEPTKRLCGGKYGWVGHRFPIKGGIAFRDILVGALVNTHPMMRKEPAR